MSFAIPLIWREPQFYGENGCNFCSVTLGSINFKPNYLSLECSIAPVPHNDRELPVPSTKINQKMVNDLSTATVKESQQDMFYKAEKLFLWMCFVRSGVCQR